MGWPPELISVAGKNVHPRMSECLLGTVYPSLTFALTHERRRTISDASRLGHDGSTKHNQTRIFPDSWLVSKERYEVLRKSLFRGRNILRRAGVPPIVAPGYTPCSRWILIAVKPYTLFDFFVFFTTNSQHHRPYSLVARVIFV